MHQASMTERQRHIRMGNQMVKAWWTPAKLSKDFIIKNISLGEVSSFIENSTY